ncbi:RbsD/FucU family protein [Actinosynnema pretiosum subsp. pretiosum]|uniref:RbsD or FucU transport n=2 Tax=Actinosynnema TaxID=40566 RepID=C6WJV2_ACTMD|nr:RbsD/FucU family protein [Actinosynnema mirum]ACU36327.1 RbsD or FucU transport [Actinosynnema mirum DSM 43827]AXX29779.1 L-fucose mutarotase [Actinosynnema pretiosum subsp. pretiosum]QUF06008.1 RbsD/FucU family protein [Actinosynnema pretiosum subsp. pretiosum]
MLRYPLLHPPLLAVLAASGHGSKVLIADSNYAHRTNVHPAAEIVHLNLTPGLLTVDQVLAPVLTAVPVEAAHAMRPDEGGTPEVWADYERLLGPDLPLQPLARQDFYDTCKSSDLAVCVATGDTRLYANVLLTIGFVA